MNSLSSSLLGSLQNTGKHTAERSSQANSAGNEASASFSQLLRDNKPPAPAPVAAAAPAPTPAPSSAAPAPAPAAARQGDGKTESQRQDARLNARRAAGQAEAKPGNAAADKSADAGKTATNATEPDKTQDSQATGDEAPAADAKDPACEPATAQPAPIITTPVLATTDPQILALLARAGLAPDAAATEAGDGTERPDADAGNKPGGLLPRGRGDAAAAQAASRAQDNRQADATAAAHDFGRELQDAAAQSLPQQVLQTLKGAGPSRGPGGEGGASVESLLSASASNPTASLAQASAPDTPTVLLAQPLHEPAFASELAARLSLLAVDGVQEAQLHLNPAEMGPVAVQIVVDGQQAQISFHAEQAETRAVLEQSLPDLAAALRDSGLTLSGGGVFQQPARDQQAQASAQRAHAGGRGGREADEGVQALGIGPAPARASRGVLDLYA